MPNSVNTSLTVNSHATGSVGPPEPAALPNWLCRSGEKTADSERHSAPKLTFRPSSATGILIPYLPRSPVTEPDMISSVVVASTSSGIDRYCVAACVTPLGTQMFQGTHFGSAPPGSAAAQVGTPPGPGTTVRAFWIFALLK